MSDPIQLDDFFAGGEIFLETGTIRLQTVAIHECQRLLNLWSPHPTASARFEEYLDDLELSIIGEAGTIGALPQIDRHLPQPLLLSRREKDEPLGLLAWVDWNLAHASAELSVVAASKSIASGTSADSLADNVVTEGLHPADAYHLVTGIKILTEAGFAAMHLHRVEARPVVGRPERKLYQEAGMIHEATLREARRIDQDYYDVDVLGIIRP